MEITLRPTIKQDKAFEILEDHTTREFLFGGGAGGGKSWLGCEWLISMCLRYPNTKYFIARKRLKTIKQTTLVTFFKVCKSHGLKKDVHYKYKEQMSLIEFPQTGATIDLLEVDFKPSDPEYEDLGSSEYTSGWIEEAGEIHFGAYDTLSSRINRQLNDKYNVLGKLFVTANPKKNFLYKLFYKPWKDSKLPPNRAFLQSLVDDNPLGESGYREQLVNLKNQAKKQRLLYGNWEYDDDPAVLINFEAIADLFTNTTESSEEKYLTCDVARFGSDLTVIKLWKGLRCFRVIIRRKQATNVTTDLIRSLAEEKKIPYSHIVIDEDGVGGGIVDSLPGVRGFVANSKPLEDIRIDPNIKDKDKPNFRNLKAQCAYMLAEEINNHRMAVKPKLVDFEEEIDFEEKLTEDLEQIRAKDVDNDDKKLDIISKEEVKESIGRSPDFGDNLIMRMIFFLNLPKPKGNNKVFIHRPKNNGFSVYRKPRG